MTGDLPLLSRAGLPDEVVPLRPLFPREVWPEHPNLGAMARFWLQRHGMFRTLGADLRERTAALRDGGTDPREGLGGLVPRFNLYLQELHTHHHVEDEHYFPVFRAAEARLGRGFDILDADHHAIDELLRTLVDAGQEAVRAVVEGGEAARAMEQLAVSMDRTTAAVLRHLEDEEDIVMPLILDRTEAALGVG